MSEADIIRKMRQAMEVLKLKYREADGVWSMLEFMEAASDPDHWMHQIVEAERLSDPYLTEPRP